MDWRPIETAPKDGSPIWLSTSANIRVGFWEADRWVDLSLAEHGGGRRDLLFTPTHWMPLPEPPDERQP